jgi:ATP-dependent DNA ligase
MDGYRMHARLHRSVMQSGALDAGRVQILTRRGNIWTDKYPAMPRLLPGCPQRTPTLMANSAVLPRWPDGVQPHPERRRRPGFLVFFLDLLFLDGEDLTAPLVDRKARLAKLLTGAPPSLQYNDHQIGHGLHSTGWRASAARRNVSKRIDGRYEADDIMAEDRASTARSSSSSAGPIRRAADTDHSRFGYYTPEDELIYAGRVGTGMPVAELERVWRRLQPLAVEDAVIGRRHAATGRIAAGAIPHAWCGPRWWSRSAVE